MGGGVIRHALPDTWPSTAVREAPRAREAQGQAPSLRCLLCPLSGAGQVTCWAQAGSSQCHTSAEGAVAPPGPCQSEESQDRAEDKPFLVQISIHIHLLIAASRRDSSQPRSRALLQGQVSGFALFRAVQPSPQST